jgi:2-polyprenyl-3-methyl-5-hydroxy-6-metoxy-1,4-benzoquinol methylase
MIKDSANDINNYGKTILQEMSISSDFLRWSIELSRSGLFGKLIEISCGLGNNLDDLNEQCTDLWASDYNEEYLKTVASEKTYLSGTILWDIEKPPDFEIQFDSFFCSNVLEHIEDDENAMCNIAKIPNIKKGVIIVPANNYIYSRIDKNLGHYRRYDKKMLHK